MIITRAPLRMSFVGGGSDLASYYERYGGAVISSAINKYVFVTINKKFDDAIRISYSLTENVPNIGEVQHAIVRACMLYTGVTSGVEITTIADIPAHGTGLGSSSSFTTSLLQGLYAYKGQYISAAQLAEEACHIEIDVCGSPIGKQDQYAAAFGGFNHILFNRDGTVVVTPIICDKNTIKTIEKNLLMLYTGRTRSASTLLAKQTARTREDATVQTNLHKMVALTEVLRDELQANKVESFGEILHTNWQLKRSLMSGISDDYIDDWYNRGLNAGATGGKILGAGAGGFLLFYAPQDRHEAIIQALPELRPIPITFEQNGTSVIFYH